MPLIDPTTGEVSDAAFGIDNHGLAGGDSSIFDTVGNVLTKGVPLTGLAVANSFANTAIDVSNWFGGESKRLSIADEVGDGEMLDYYNQHQQGIEAAALVAGSLIPGTIAIKALKLAQLGKAGLALQRATNIFAGPKDRLIEGALSEINSEDALYTTLQADKYKAIALGAGDQALQALAYQVATAATMKASPLLDQEGLSDVISDTFYGTLVGAGIGGLIEGVGIRGIFNKAILNADIKTKSQELATYLGRGSYVSGDRAAELVRSIDAIPEPTTALGRVKTSFTKDRAALQAKSILGDLVDEGDEEVSNKFFDTLMQMRIKGGMDKEEMYERLARLAKITRVTGDDSGVSDGAAFYVNRIAKGETYGADDLITAAPRYNFDNAATATADEAAIKAAGTSLRYQLREGSDNFKIAKHTDSITWDGAVVPLYDTAADAWEQGFDFYVNRANQISINPKAPNVVRTVRPGESRMLSKAEEREYRLTGNLPEGKSLQGAPLTLNLATGDLKNEIVPVVGDFGGIKVLDKGLMYGENFSQQSLAKPLTAEFSPIDANARFVWAAKRGIQAGDSIASTDIPFLEQLLREGTASKSWDEAVAGFERRGISIEGENLPTSAQELIGRIKLAKDDLINDLLRKSDKISSEEIARTAGVSEDYLAGMMKSDNAKDYILDPSASAELNHVKLWYDIGNTTINDGMIRRGAIDVAYRIGVIKDALTSATAKYFGEDFSRFISTSKSSDATISGTGSKFLSASNSAYDSLGQEMERIGRNLTAWYQQKIRQVSTVLTPAANQLRQDDVAAAELGMFRAVRQRTSERFIFLSPELAAKYGLAEADGSSNIAVLSDSLVKDKVGNILDWNKDYVPDNFHSGEQFSYHDAIGDSQTGNYTYYRLSEKVADWERANVQLNNQRIIARNNFNAASGLAKSYPLDTLYTPPINTSEHRFFALVKLAAGTGMGEDDTAVITGANAKELETKINLLRSQNFSVYTKEDLKTYHEVQGDYEYSRNFAQSQVDSSLKSKGILNDVLPETRAEGLIKDYVDWHSRQEMLISRDHVELGNSQLFAELRAMGDRFQNVETSRTGFVPDILKKSAENPYMSYVKTALAISSKDNYRLWSETQERLESFFDTAFNTAKRAFVAANKGIIPFEQASAMAERFGLGNVYGNGVQALRAYSDIANKLPDTRILSRFVSTANSILGSTVIKLDTFQQMIHILSTPILTMSEANSAKQWLTTELPDGSGKQIPATSKIFFKALSDYFNKDTFNEWMPQYQKAGFIRDPDVLRDHYQLIDQLALPFGKFSESGITQQINNATKLAEKFVGTRFSEAYTSWMAARTGHLIFDAAGYEGQDLFDNIGTFVNRAKANITASQRPVAFQGPLGQAVGLFQTYYFNLMQQVFRYVGNKEAKTLGILAGMQTSLFGLSSLPGFHFINDHIIGDAAGNPFHKDIYGGVTNFFDPKLGDYLLYGVTSNWLNAGLFSRGDTNPRNVSLLPVNPLNYPAIAGGIRFLSNIAGVASKITQGGDIPSSILMGLEHNGLSRPLMGLAQLAQGYSTTSKGSLIASTRPVMGDNSAGMSDLISAANFSRLLGARPLDEAVALDANYRTEIYKAKDNARVESLGEAAKTTMIGNRQPDTSEVSNFAARYAKAGGDIAQFGRSMAKWSQDANTSIANKVFRSMGKQVNQQQMLQMGGLQLPDYRNQMPSVSPPSGQTPDQVQNPGSPAIP